jgi:hypothetical protein
MYLAHTKIKGQAHYYIRESYQQDGLFRSRNLIDLGTDPARYIIYPGGNAFYIDPVIEDRIAELGTEADPDELERIFWKFVHPEVRRRLEHFRAREDLHRAHRRKKGDRRKGGQHRAKGLQVHIFDQRRVHFLKFGQTDQRNIGRMPPKLFRMLHNKSRDEIEQGFMDMESVLAPREYKTYTYTIFNLQQFFNEFFAKGHPQMLSQQKVDKHFIEQICRLNTDPLFWSGMECTDNLHEYLVRYVLMHFDYDYAPGSYVEEYLRQFINSRREYRPPFKNAAAVLKKAGRIFGENAEGLEKMSRKELARLYRRKAQELHPDKGGAHDEFVRLTEAYHAVLQTKKK